MRWGGKMPEDNRYKTTIPDVGYWSDMVKCRAGREEVRLALKLS